MDDGDEKAFEKWAPLLALCRDAMRVLPRDWREKRVEIDGGGELGDRFVFVVTNGVREWSYSWGSGVQQMPDHILKHEVASVFIKMGREILGDDRLR